MSGGSFMKTSFLRRSLLILCLVFAGNSVAFAEPEKVEHRDNNTRFTLELFQRLGKDGENLAFSPSSIETAFAVALSGARGDTANEIARVFHTSPGGEDRFILELEEQLSLLGKKGDLQVSTANGLWIATTLPIIRDFIELAKTKFHAEVRPGDFQNAAETVRQEINAWVLKKTQEKIPDLIAPGMLDAATSLVIVNALYFKGDWQAEFKKESTYIGDFLNGRGKTLQVPLMPQLGYFNYSDSNEAQLLELPYKGDDISMLVLLPKSRDGLKRLEESLTETSLASMINTLNSKEVSVTLPKFKMRNSMRLADVLQSLGIKTAFVFKQADFSGIEATKSVFISEVIHQAFIQTDEKGTEAAAATAIVMESGSMRQQEQPVIFNADHPFLFFLRETKTGGILLMGRVADPS